MSFETKDSGERVEFGSGMVRDTQDGKPRWGLIPRAALKRVAELYGRGSAKYGDRNWEQANSAEELERFGESAYRHLMQFLDGETDEDHGAAVVFNVFALMTLRDKLARPAGEIVHLPPDATTADVAAALAGWGRRNGMAAGGKPTYPCPECAAPEGAYHHRGCHRGKPSP